MTTGDGMEIYNQHSSVLSNAIQSYSAFLQYDIILVPDKLRVIAGIEIRR